MMYKTQKHEATNENPDVVYGKNSVSELLKSGKALNKVLLDNSKPHGELIEILKNRKVVFQLVDRKALDKASSGENHQGVVAYVPPFEYAELDDILAKAEKEGKPPFIVIFDGVSDPHNVGSIIRTAHSAGVHGIIIPKRGGCPITHTVAKTSSGALEHTLVARVTNIPQTLETLKEKGLWIVGTDFGKSEYTSLNLRGAIGLVIGSEGDGMGRLVKEKCDFLATIPMLGEVQSLNASVAAGIMMYEIVRQNRAK